MKKTFIGILIASMVVVCFCGGRFYEYKNPTIHTRTKAPETSLSPEETEAEYQRDISSIVEAAKRDGWEKGKYLTIYEPIDQRYVRCFVNANKITFIGEYEPNVTVYKLDYFVAYGDYAYFGTDDGSTGQFKDLSYGLFDEEPEIVYVEDLSYHLQASIYK